MSDIQFLDREYNPRTQVPEFAEYFSRWKRMAGEAREATRARLDVRYGPASAETLDLFPAEGPAAPLLIFLHGGYWRALDKRDFSWIAPPYVAAGVSVAIVNYGLSPATAIEEIVQQVRRACAWLYQNAHALNVDPNRLVCSGHSAGGHLAAMMLATDWPAVSAGLPQASPGLPRRLLAGALSISGLFDLAPLVDAEFLRHDLRLDQNSARELSPAFLPWRNHAPLIRAVGALESSEFHHQSRLMQQHWPDACDRPLMDIPGCNHFTVCDALAVPGGALFEAACSVLFARSTI
jgi:arylformamidase